MTETLPSTDTTDTIGSAVTPRPERFTRAELGWEPWLEPLAADDLTDAHWHGLVERSRANSDYFRLLVRDPGILHARTKTDFDIFHNRNGGLPRAERELAAAAASRVNGCIFCASVHARFAAHYAKAPAEVQRLLDDGVDAPQSDRWHAVIAAAAALTATPSALTADHLRALAATGLDLLGISDVLHSAAFFGWANRLMLSLGEPFGDA